MSGHSKWANIKNKKEKTDAARGKIFTKIGREIVIAVKEGGGPDPANNSKLRDVIAKAKAANMPNDNINRSIKKAAGEAGSVNYEEITYEGYGPGNLAVYVEIVTDNRNRISAEMRHIFSKAGGNLGATGSVAWMFDKKGQIIIERTALMDEDEVMMEALDAGAEDFVAQDDAFEVYTAPSDFSAVREALEGKGYTFLSAEVAMIPQNTVDISDPETVEKVNRFHARFPGARIESFYSDSHSDDPMATLAERAWLVRFPEAARYTIGFSGVGVAGDPANSDREAMLDGLSLVRVKGTVDDVPLFETAPRIKVAQGSRLVLDFPGTLRTGTVTLGGVQYTGLISAETHPEYVGGIGTLDARYGGISLSFK